MRDQSICRAFLNDIDYFKSLRSGDDNEVERAWFCLYSNHVEYKLKVLAHLGYDKHEWENIKDAEDAYHESIIAVVNGIRTGAITPGKAKISTYLFSCCKFQVLGIKRKKIRFTREEFTPLQKRQAEDEIDFLLAMELEREYRQKVDLIKKAIGELRKNCADILTKVLLEDETPLKVAEERNTGLKSLRTEISRCKNELSALLISKYKFSPDGLWL